MQNTIERIEIGIYTDEGKPIDPIQLQLNILNSADQLVSTDVFYPGPGQIVDPTPSRIVRFAKGRYYFPFGIDNANGYPAVLFSQNAPAPTWDISVNNQLQISLDGKAPITITLISATPTTATQADVTSSINQALFSSPTYGVTYYNTARFYQGLLFLISPQVVNVSKSSITLNLTIPNNAAQVIFGPSVAPIASGNNANIYIASLLSNRTLYTGDSLFQWQARAAKGLGSISILQVVKVASPKAFSILPYFRNQLDKALKQVGNNLARTGYTDAQLMGYLALAVTEINMWQPVTGLSLDSFPIRDFMMILIWTATLVALYSQGLFAIDTDVDYSDRGASFRIDHSSKINSIVTMLTSRLQTAIPQFKLIYADVGTVKIEPVNASYRLDTLLSSAPPGALFRGLFTSGG